MSRTMLAPALKWAFYGRKGEHGTVRNVDMDSAQADKCERELRALLAVASAAERDLDHLAASLHLSRERLSDVAEDTTGKLARALARLARLSSPPSRRTARAERKTR